MVGALPLATVMATAVDEPIRSVFDGSPSWVGDRTSDLVRQLGDGRYTLPVAGLLWWAGSGGRFERLATASRNAFQSWILVQGVVQTGKYTLGRSRPFREDGPLHFEGIVLTDDSRHSFPSGHTATAWGLLPAYAMEFSDHPWLSVSLYGLAAGVGLSRIRDDQHWTSDVWFSAATGWLCNRLVRSLHAHSGPSARIRWDVLPQVGDRGGVVVVAAY